jgi:CRP/FNR family transcriptional regulator
MAQKLRLIKEHHRCKHCLFRSFFQNVGLNADEIDDTGQKTTINIGPYQPGEYIYRTGEPSNALYVVHTGSVKTEMHTYDGDLYVNGFYLIGELFGVDGTYQRRFGSDAVAIEKTWVCELSLDNWARLAKSHPELQGELIAELGRILAHKEHQALSGHYHLVEQRLLSFLVDLRDRLRIRQGIPLNEIRLSMKKGDIAGYLGIAPESVSRALAKLEKIGYIVNHGSWITILKEPCDLNMAM